MCPRNYRGLDYNSGYPVTELSLSDIQKILRSDFLKIFSKNYGTITFNGNLGDFSSARDALEIVRYLSESDVPIKINTNGSARSPAWWKELALPKVTVGFALDGLSDTHHLYRQDTDWNRVIRNAKSFISAGGRAVWRFVPFDHNRHQEQSCRDLAKELGFADFENIWDGRDNGPVYTRTGDFSHWLGSPWPGDVPPIDDMLISHRTWFRIDTVTSKKDRPDTQFSCIHKKQKEIYIAADGSIYPCCFLGFYPRTMNHPGNEQLIPLLGENNALEYPLEHCLAWFDRVEETWSRSSIQDGRLYQCVNSCGR